MLGDRGAGLVVLAATAVFLVVQAWPALRHYGFFSFLELGAVGALGGGGRQHPAEPLRDRAVHLRYGAYVADRHADRGSGLGGRRACSSPMSRRAWLRQPLSYLVDLLAAIPSVVYGFWGIFALSPALHPVGQLPDLDAGQGARYRHGLFTGPFFGVSYFTAGDRAGDHGAADHHRHLPRGLRHRAGR